MSNKLLTSSIGKKLIMGISGLFFVLFMLFHAIMNLTAVFSPTAYDAICAFLGANWYALLGTLILAAGFFIHILYSIIITLGNRKSRGNQRYDKEIRPKEVLWASKNMFVLGSIVLLGIGLHLYQFWANMQFVEIMGGTVNSLGFSATSGASLIAHYFSNPLWVAIYLVWFVALWLHMNHGFWSGMQTIGWNNQIWLPRLQLIGKCISTFVCGAFALVAIWFYIKSIM